MLKNTCITYNNPSHQRFQEEFERLYSDKFSQYHAYNREWIEKTEFFKKNSYMFSLEKYAGYFLWKPYCIKTTLDLFFSGQVLYCDCNLRFKNFKRFEELYNEYMLQEGMFVIKHLPWVNAHWTKRDTFILMNADEARYWEAHQVWSVILGFDNNPRSREILDDYLYYCRSPQIVTEYPNMCGEPNIPGFREHRWEQSVISILVERYGIKGVWDVDVLDVIEKVYDTDLYAYKEQVNKNPLRKVGQDE